MNSRKWVSVSQIELLVEFLEAHEDLAFGRQKSKEASAQSFRLWAECAEILNAEADGDKRTPKQWNKWYTDYKCRLLQKIRLIKKNQHDTGEGTGITVSSLSPLEERLATLLGANSMVVVKTDTPQDEVQKSLCRNENSNIVLYANAADAQNNIITESRLEATTSLPTHTARKQRHPRRHLNRQGPLPTSKLERSQSQLAALKYSRIEVERQMATGYVKMAEAMNKMADAANKSADAANKSADAANQSADAASKSADAASKSADAASKSADALCQIAEAVGKICQTVENINARLNFLSSEEDN